MSDPNTHDMRYGPITIESLFYLGLEFLKRSSFMGRRAQWSLTCPDGEHTITVIETFSSGTAGISMIRKIVDELNRRYAGTREKVTSVHVTIVGWEIAEERRERLKR